MIPTPAPGHGVDQQRFVLTVDQANLLCARVPHLSRPSALPHRSVEPTAAHITALLECGALVRRPDPRTADWTREVNPVLALLIAQQVFAHAVIRLCTWGETGHAEHTVALLSETASHMHLSSTETAVSIELTAVAQVWRRLLSVVVPVLGDEAARGRNTGAVSAAPSDGHAGEVVVTPHAVAAITEAGHPPDAGVLAAAVNTAALGASATLDQLIAVAQWLDAPARSGIRITAHAPSLSSAVAVTWLRTGPGWLRVRTRPCNETREQGTRSRSERVADTLSAPVMVLPQRREHVRADLLHLVATVLRSVHG